MNKNMNEWWESFRSKYLKTVRKNLECPGATDDFVTALVFWRFVRNVVFRQIPVDERRGFLILNAFNKNPNIAVISQLESLPDEVFKKVLWRGNIDFSSYEAFLRRLEADQRQLIATTFNELYNLEHRDVVVPTVYKKSLRDRIKFSLKRKTRAKVLKGTYGANSRRESRNAWAFNLLGLDFGFGLYPHGVGNDQKISNAKFTRFLSIKEHINDFSVNQFDGKYWWLYSTARSNYVWKPGKKVELKTHICPGFWWTLIAHTLFWIVSPIFFLTMNGLMHHLHGEPWWQRLLTIAGYALSFFPTPLFIAIAFLRIVGEIVAAHFAWFKRLGKQISRWLKRHDSYIDKVDKILESSLKGLKFILKAALLVAVVWIVWAVFKRMEIPVTSRLLFESVTIYHLWWIMYDEKDSSYNDVPKWVRIASFFVVLSIVLHIYERYAEIRIVEFLSNLFLSTSDFTLRDPLATIGIIIGVGAFALNTQFMVTVYTNERKFALHSKIIRWYAIGSVFLSALCFHFSHIDVSDVGSLGTSISFAVLLFSLLSAMSVIFYTVPINTETIDKREGSKLFLDHLYSRFYEKFLAGSWASDVKDFLKKHPKLKFKKLLNNPWLMTFSNEKEINQAVERLFLTLLSIAEKSNPDVEQQKVFISRFFRNNLPTMTSGHYFGLKRIELAFMNRSRFDLFDFQELENIVRDVFSGEPVGKAFDRVIKTREEAWKRVMVRRLRIIKVFSPITWCFIKVRQIFLTLKDLRELFYERCPYVSKPTILK